MGGVCSVLGTNRLNVGDYLSTDGTIVGPANVKERASWMNPLANQLFCASLHLAQRNF